MVDRSHFVASDHQLNLTDIKIIEQIHTIERNA